MDAEARRKVEEYVRPLAVGLDGVTNYGDVERMVSAAEAIAAGATGLDADLLFLLAVFSGQEKWVSRMGHRSRTEIFLASLGVAAADGAAALPGPRALRDGARRRPRRRSSTTPCCSRRWAPTGSRAALADAYRERLDILEMADAIEAAAAAPLRTEAGRRLAGPRRERDARVRRASCAPSTRSSPAPRSERPRFPGAALRHVRSPRGRRGRARTSSSGTTAICPRVTGLAGQ